MRWYVRTADGKAMGPLEGEAVRLALTQGVKLIEVAPEDSQKWVPVESVPAFEVAAGSVMSPAPVDPTPAIRSKRPFNWGWIPLSALAGLLLWFAFGVRSYLTETRANNAERAAAIDRELAAQREEAFGSPSPESERGRRAAEAWAEFDRLPSGEFRTKEMLGAYLMKANQAASGLPDDERSAVIAANAAEFRSRLPALMVVGERGVALGADYSAIVPSRDPARCVKLAESWSKGEMRAALTGFGYRAIQCPDAPTGRDQWILK